MQIDTYLCAIFLAPSEARRKHERVLGADRLIVGQIAVARVRHVDRVDVIP